MILIILAFTASALYLKVTRDLKFEFYHTHMKIGEQTIPMIVDINSQFTTVEECTTEECPVGVYVIGDTYREVSNGELVGGYRQLCRDYGEQKCSYQESLMDSTEHTLLLSQDLFEDRPIIFGLINDQVVSSVKNVLGLGVFTGKSFNNRSFPPSVFQLHNQSFQLCLGKEAGYIQDPIYSNQTITTLNYTGYLAKYEINLQSLMIDDIQIEIIETFTYIDTISPYILVPETILKKIRQAFLDRCQECEFTLLDDNHICLETQEQPAKVFLLFPSINLVIDSQIFEITAINYMVLEYGSTYCFGFRHIKGSKLILGQPFIINKLMTFRSNQIDFQHDQCTSRVEDQYNTTHPESTGPPLIMYWVFVLIIIVMIGLIMQKYDIFKLMRKKKLVAITTNIKQTELTPNVFLDEEDPLND